MRRHYSSSKLVSWMRDKVFKIEKPTSLQWGGWKTWDDKLKKERPIAFFFTETLPDWIEWVPAHTIDYINNIRYYVTNRVNNSHQLTSTLKKGSYQEFSQRLLYSAFDSYIDFIEIEEASIHIAWRDKEETAKYNVPFWRRHWIFRWGKAWRSPEAAIDHLKWEMTLDTPNPADPNWMSSPHQAIAAREKMALYTWWKHVRPQRGESWDVSGFRDFWNKMDNKYGEDWLGLGGNGKMTAHEQRTYRKLSDANEKLEEMWEEEDDAMLIRLVKIRKSLWT